MSCVIRALLCIATYAAVLAPASVFAQDEVVYFHTDAIGSVRMVTDSAGQEVARYDYLPFGEPWPSSGAQETRRFGGKERDPETAFDYFGARDYQSQTGRFTTVDPGHVGGDIYDPQSWNGYAYARNNPLKYTDPTGTDYDICAYGGSGYSGSCGSVSDQYFTQLYANPGAGITLLGGAIFAGNKVVGHYRYAGAGINDLFGRTGQLAAAELKYGTIGMGIAASGGALGGLAVGALSGGIGSGLTTLAIGTAPLLPAVPSALDKLQKIGVSLQQAAQIVTSPGSRRFIDTANSNNINVIQQVGDKLVRITLDPTGQRIISAGYVQGRNVANSIASGRFIPQ